MPVYLFITGFSGHGYFPEFLSFRNIGYMNLDFGHVDPCQRIADACEAGKRRGFCQNQTEKYQERRRRGKDIQTDRKMPAGTA